MAHSPDADEAAAAAGVFSKHGCCSFWIPWPSSVRGCKAWERIPSGEGGCPAASRRWWGRGLRALLKVGQASRAMASRRLRTLIRRFRRRDGRPRHRRSFSYDALSYARNFDEGTQAGDSDVDNVRLGFSIRYASSHSPPTKPLVDLSPPFAGATH
ncbi:uncharacterized protein LOC122050221 [Zingiber officinale]|uniref:Uncharacterized protein n=1 Tax=Zingiber officinale TaxID=94328 RepID=A0A8J5LA44_ZINOF|nr:uncharacterized protein LOC122050221 [Zingiber officinale]KAG6520212.1 hypothetical protein ZIOFF_017250 [Zingiber officinale]